MSFANVGVSFDVRTAAANIAANVASAGASCVKPEGTIAANGGTTAATATAMATAITDGPIQTATVGPTATVIGTGIAGAIAGRANGGGTATLPPYFFRV